jgi:hypothetical protein
MFQATWAFAVTDPACRIENCRFGVWEQKMRGSLLQEQLLYDFVRKGQHCPNGVGFLKERDTGGPALSWLSVALVVQAFSDRHRQE